MTCDGLKLWRERMRMTTTEAAKALGVSLDTYARLERRTVVDRRTALACAALAFGLPPME